MLIIVQNLPVPSTGGCGWSARRSSGGLRRHRDLPAGGGHRPVQVVDGVRILAYPAYAPGGGHRLPRRVRLLLPRDARLRSGARRGRSVRRRAGLQPSRHLLAARPVAAPPRRHPVRLRPPRPVPRALPVAVRGRPGVPTAGCSSLERRPSAPPTASPPRTSRTAAIAGRAGASPSSTSPSCAPGRTRPAAPARAGPVPAAARPRAPRRLPRRHGSAGRRRHRPRRGRRRRQPHGPRRHRLHPHGGRRLLRRPRPPTRPPRAAGPSTCPDACPDETWREVLSTADVGLSPDPLNPLNDVSTMNKTMEYMAFGLPVVAFDLRETRVSPRTPRVYVRAERRHGLRPRHRRPRRRPGQAARDGAAGPRARRAAPGLGAPAGGLPRACSTSLVGHVDRPPAAPADAGGLRPCAAFAGPTSSPTARCSSPR